LWYWTFSLVKVQIYCSYLKLCVFNIFNFLCTWRTHVLCLQISGTHTSYLVGNLISSNYAWDEEATGDNQRLDLIAT
jgi:hypothetical protein